MEEAEKKYDKPRIGKTMAFCWRCLLYRCWLSTKYNTSILISFFFRFFFSCSFRQYRCVVSTMYFRGSCTIKHSYIADTMYFLVATIMTVYILLSAHIIFFLSLLIFSSFFWFHFNHFGYEEIEKKYIYEIWRKKDRSQMVIIY